MCDLCRKVSGDPEYKKSIGSLFNSINERIKATRQEPGDAVAFSTNPFPNIDFALFEPRMSLQLPSHLYQSMNVDGQHLRSDWASGWLRAFGFKEKMLYLITQAFRRVEGKEILLYLHMVGFEPSEYSFKEEGQKLILKVTDIKKEGSDLFEDKTAAHTYSFIFTHQPTDRASIPRDRVENSALIKSAFHGKLPQKPLTFDWSKYVVTVPHFAPHSILHQDYKRYGFNSAMEMQNSVTGFLKEHLKQ